MKLYLQIDVLSFFRHENDLNHLKNKIKDLISARESLFDSCFDASQRILDLAFITKKKELYINHFNDYMQYLKNISYITEEQKIKFCIDFKNILDAHTAYFTKIAEQYNIT